MDRIKQALELAQRSGPAAAFGRPTPVAQETPAHSAQQPPQGPGARGELAVAYTQTRRLTLTADVMERNRLITGIGKDPVTAAYKLLRTQVLQRLREHRWNTVAVVSAKAEEGRTLTAINLAISLAQEVTSTVLLVDLNLRTPNMHRYFEFDPLAGLSEYLMDGVPLQDVLVNPGIERLVVLPGGRPIANSSEMLSSPRMHAMVEELRQRYASRIVLFDLPPLLATDDALAFCPFIDAAVLVVEDGRNPEREMQRALDMLQTTNLLGAVLNKYNNRD